MRDRTTPLGKGNGTDNLQLKYFWNLQPQHQDDIGHAIRQSAFLTLRHCKLFPAQIAGTWAGNCRAAPVSLEKIREGFLDPHRIKAKHGVVTGRIERIFGGKHFAPEKPSEATRIKVSPDKRFLAEMIPEGEDEGFVGRAVDCLAVGKSLTCDDLRGTVLVGVADDELVVRPGETPRKTAVFFHQNISHSQVPAFRR
jgi:hypothetical protein